MSTTFERFPAGKAVGNYSSRPTIDVEILEDGYECSVEDCEQPDVAYVADRWEGDGEHARFIRGGWVHVEGGRYDHVATPKPKCRFCGGTDCLTYRQEAWYDATDCSRCGGVGGFAIGD